MNMYAKKTPLDDVADGRRSTVAAIPRSPFIISCTIPPTSFRQHCGGTRTFYFASTVQYSQKKGGKVKKKKAHAMVKDIGTYLLTYVPTQVLYE